MQLIKKMFGRGPGAGPTPGSESAQFQDSDSNSELASRNTPRRELVQVVLRDCLRRHGIPARWMGCQMMVAESRSRGPGLYICLVLRHWDERLLRYAFAFETQLRDAITQFEPQANTWLHGISWELDLRSSCPYPDMPEPASWVTPARLISGLPEDSPEAVGAKVDAEDDILQDLKELERMFAVRDDTRDSPAHLVGADFQKTRPLATK